MSPQRTILIQPKAGTEQRIEAARKYYQDGISTTWIDMVDHWRVTLPHGISSSFITRIESYGFEAVEIQGSADDHTIKHITSLGNATCMDQLRFVLSRDIPGSTEQQQHLTQILEGTFQYPRD